MKSFREMQSEVIQKMSNSTLSIGELKELVDQAYYEDPNLGVRLSVAGEYQVRAHSASVRTDSDTEEQYFLIRDW